jgi:hypothetical protein
MTNYLVTDFPFITEDSGPGDKHIYSPSRGQGMPESQYDSDPRIQLE